MAKTLTDHLKDIGNEETTITINGETHTCSKTEAVARRMFLMAEGGTEEIMVDGEAMERVYKPDYRVAKSIREFIEGKAGVEPPKETKGNAKPGRFSSETASRLNDRLGPAKPTRPKVPSGVTQP